MTVDPVTRAIGLLLGAALTSVLAGCGHNGRTENLLSNPDAEEGESWTGGTAVPVPGWTGAGGATVIRYGTGAYPAVDSPGPEDRGLNLFIGLGPIASHTQTVDVSPYASAIDDGATTFELSGYLGGFGPQADDATVTLRFLSDGTDLGGTATLGPVTPDDRDGETGLLFRSVTGPVPRGTRSITVVLEMVRRSVGIDNDGYADNLSLVLVGI